MRKPVKVRVGFMGAFALAALQGCDGCANGVYAHCVDQDGVVVDDARCDADAGVEADGDGGDVDAAVEDGGEPDGGLRGRAGVVLYRWWYGGHVPLGSTVPSAGGSYVRPVVVGGGGVTRASTVRGGFGTPGGAHGAGE
jgi:hypothetical protein